MSNRRIDPNAYGKQNVDKISKEEKQIFAQIEKTKKSRAGSSCPSEEQEQIHFFSLIDRQIAKYPELKFVFAIPNGGFRKSFEAERLVRGGVKGGVPDVCFPQPRGGYVGWWGELKRQNGVPSDVSPKQREWLEWLASQGWKTGWYKGGQEMFDSLMEYIKLQKWNEVQK
jgi:hypothetical protein